MKQVNLSSFWVFIAFLCLSGCNGQDPVETYSHSGLGSVAAALTSDSKKALVSTVDQGVQFWDLTENKLIFKLDHGQGQSPEVVHLSLARAAPLAVTADADSVVIWNLEQGKALRQWSLESMPLDMAVSSTGKYALISLSSYKTQLMNLINGHEVQEFNSQERIDTVAISPNSHYLALGDSVGTVRIWDLNAGKIKFEIQHDKAISELTFSPDSRYLLSASAQSTSWIHEVNSGKKISQLELGSKYLLFGGLNPAVTASVFSQNGEWLVTGHPPKTIRIWQVSTGKLMKRFDVPTRTLIRPSASLPLALSLSEDQKFILCETTNGQGYRYPWPQELL